MKIILTFSNHWELGESRKMTKGELIKALEGLDDNARIFIETEESDFLLDIINAKDKVVGDDVENEITLVVGDK